MGGGARLSTRIQSLLIRYTPRAVWLFGVVITLLFFQYFLVPLGRLGPEERRSVNMDILELRCANASVRVAIEAETKCTLVASFCAHGMLFCATSALHH